MTSGMVIPHTSLTNTTIPWKGRRKTWLFVAKNTREEEEGIVE
jgi:hypothetical protein